jgi:hypothetical protein
MGQPCGLDHFLRVQNQGQPGAIHQFPYRLVPTKLFIPSGKVGKTGSVSSDGAGAAVVGGVP